MFKIYIAYDNRTRDHITDHYLCECPDRESTEVVFNSLCTYYQRQQSLIGGGKERIDFIIYACEGWQTILHRTIVYKKGNQDE